MYRTRFASLRVPDVDDDNQDAALIDLATDIQYQLEGRARRVQEIKRRRGAMVNKTTTTPLPASTLTATVWDEAVYDSDEYVDLVSDPTGISIPRGAFLIAASCYIDSTGISTGTVGFQYMVVSGAIYGGIAENQIGPTVQLGASLSATAAIYSAVPDVITLKCLQQSPDPGVIRYARMAVTKIGIM
jgi:hypothetical protein